jgi:hypothetical protein
MTSQANHTPRPGPAGASGQPTSHSRFQTLHPKSFQCVTGGKRGGELLVRKVELVSIENDVS